MKLFTLSNSRKIPVLILFTFYMCANLSAVAEASFNTETFSYLSGSYEKIENTPNGTIWCANTNGLANDNCIRINSSGELDRSQYGNGWNKVVIPITGNSANFSIKEYQEFECCGSSSLQFAGHKIELYRWSGSAYQTTTIDLVRHRNSSGVPNSGTTVIWNSWMDMVDGTINTYDFELNFTTNKGTSTVTTALGSSTGAGTLSWTTSGVSQYFDDYIPDGYESMYYLVLYTHDYSNVVSKIVSIEGLDLPSIAISENITASTTWDGKTPFVVSGNIEIEPGVTLTINPGVVVKFDTSTTSSLIVNGTLNALGTPEAGQIMFTSLKDDYFGDTNGDGASTSPSAEDWHSIVVNSGGEANLTDTIVRYGGSTSTHGTQIFNNGGELNIEDSRIVYGSTGIQNTSGALMVEGSEIASNDYGVYVSGGTVEVTDGNIFHDNNLYALYNNTITTINAEDNWWGDASGPYHSINNVFGLGDEVSSNVDFTPWDNDLHYLTGTSSVDSGEIRWGGSTKYATEWAHATSTWNALGSVDILPDDMFTNEDLTLSDVDDSDLSWVGQYTPRSVLADTLQFNEYYMDQSTADKRKMTVTHELGHALGLGHSYTGNIMYYRQSSQTTLGDQDEADYYYLWP